MTDDLHKATRQLIHDVAKKDQQFRIAQILFNLLVLILLILGMTYGYRTIQIDQKKRDQAVQKVIQEIQTSVNTQSKQLQCITNFFAQPDRADLVIADPNKCFTARTN